MNNDIYVDKILNFYLLEKYIFTNNNIFKKTIKILKINNII